MISQLQQSGYVVEGAADGEEGEYFASQFSFDLAIIDLGLPKMNGVELITSLREQQIGVPVLVLTARGHWRDKVEGLEAGADDYLTKPFRMEELLARVNALIRRSAGHSTPTLTAGPLHVDTVSQQVWVDKQLIELTGFEYKLLTHLLLLNPLLLLTRLLCPAPLLLLPTLLRQVVHQVYLVLCLFIEKMVGQSRQCSGA